MSPAPPPCQGGAAHFSQRTTSQGIKCADSVCTFVSDHITNFLHFTRILILKHINNYW
jgi:hypothetical protein